MNTFTVNDVVISITELDSNTSRIEVNGISVAIMNTRGQKMDPFSIATIINNAFIASTQKSKL